MRPFDEAVALVEALDHAEKIEDLSRRFGLPHILEHELDFFRDLRRAELQRALELLGMVVASGAAAPLAWRGRVKRLLGDPLGAAGDLRAALDIDPGLAPAHAWLGEIDLRRPEARSHLTRAIELAPELGYARLYRGAARLLAGDPRGAAQDLERYAEMRPRTRLGLLLLGLAREKQARRGAAARAYRRAAANGPTCAAAFLLLSRAERSGRRALSAAEKALDADPTYALIALSRAREAKDWPAYLASFRRFAFDEPARAGWYHRQQDVFYSPHPQQEYEDARLLLRLRPRSAWAHALVSRTSLRRPSGVGGTAEGLEMIARALRLSPGSGWLYAWRALARLKAGDEERALRDFDRAERLQPCYALTYAWRGALRRKRGLAREALQDLDRSVAVDERYAFSRRERSLARRACGDPVGAALDLDQAFRLDARYSWTFAAGREAEPAEMDAGRRELDAAIAAQPGVVSLRVWRGALSLQRRDLPAALEDLEQAVRLDPHHALAQAWSGVARMEAGRPREGAAALRRAVELEPGLTVFRGWLAQAEFRFGRGRRAFAVLGEALRRDPNSWWLRHQRALLQLEVGSPRRALADLGRSLSIEGRHAEVYHDLARAKAALSDWKGAEQAADAALALSPHLGQALVLRANAREKLGRHEEVVEDYRAAFRKFPFLFNPEQKARLEALFARS